MPSIICDHWWLLKVEAFYYHRGTTPLNTFTRRHKLSIGGLWQFGSRLSWQVQTVAGWSLCPVERSVRRLSSAPGLGYWTPLQRMVEWGVSDTRLCLRWLIGSQHLGRWTLANSDMQKLHGVIGEVKEFERGLSLSVKATHILPHLVPSPYTYLAPYRQVTIRRQRNTHTNIFLGPCLSTREVIILADLMPLLPAGQCS